MASTIDKTDGGGELLTGLVAVGSVIANLVQLADRSNLERDRNLLKARLLAAGKSIEDLRAQLSLRIRHVQALQQAYQALKDETSELNRIIELSTAENADLRRQLADAVARLDAVETERNVGPSSPRTRQKRAVKS